MKTGESITALCSYEQGESKQTTDLLMEKRENIGGGRLGQQENSLVRYSSPKLGFSTGFQGTQNFTPGGFQRALEAPLRHTLRNGTWAVEFNDLTVPISRISLFVSGPNLLICSLLLLNEDRDQNYLSSCAPSS